MIVGIVILTLVILSIGIICIARHANTAKYALSFRDSMDLVDLPVVTFYNGHKKFNMLLDTGSTECIISREYLNNLIYEGTGMSREMFGMEGETVVNPIVSSTISYSGLKFDVEFLAADMSQAFGMIKKENGVTIHGILGSNFFARYKYVLDFDKLMFYKK